MDRIICVVGPTASGKTKLAVQLAKAYDGEVVSCDSMQIYKHMDIGTAKPTEAEMEGIPHHMIDVAEPEENWSAARYVEAATQCVEDIFHRGKRPIIVGGTGLYIDSLISGHSFAVQSTGWRQKLQAQAAAEGIEPLRATLKQVDLAAYERIQPADEKRIIRALEVWYETGKTITQHDAAPPIPYGYSIARICSIRDCFFCLRIVHTDKISSIPNNTRMNSPISKTGN